MPTHTTVTAMSIHIQVLNTVSAVRKHVLPDNCGCVNNDITGVSCDWSALAGSLYAFHSFSLHVHVLHNSLDRTGSGEGNRVSYE